MEAFNVALKTIDFAFIIVSKFSLVINKCRLYFVYYDIRNHEWRFVPTFTTK